MTKSVLVLPLLLWCAVSGVSAAEPEVDDGGRATARSIQTQLKQAEEYVVLGEPDAALAKYEQLLAKHGKTASRFTIRLALGRFYYQQKQFEKAMEHFTRAAGDATGRADHNPDLAARVDALYHVGMCFVELGQHERCFPSFRQVLELAPGSQLANQAYFQIAEAHYANQNFTQAIANYTLVGTSLDGDQIDSHRCELGKPLFIRIQDQDFLIMDGKRIVATVTTSDGDREDVVMRPLRPGSDTYVGSISTALGVGKPGDGDLSATGTTKLAIAYQDAQTAAGTLDVPRTADLVFVGDARVAVTDGAFRDAISQVILDQGAGNLNLRVVDLDRDTGDAIDKVEVELLVEQPVAKDELAKDDDKEPKYQERGRLTVALVETVVGKRGEASAEPTDGGGVRTGTFTVTQAIALDGKGGGLAVAIGDRLTAVYRDARHLEGDVPVVRETHVLVVPGSASNLQVAGTNLDDANLKVRKELLQAETAMRIGEVYRDMGLETHAQRRFDEALDSCRRVGQISGTYDRELHEQTLHTLWRIYLAKGDFAAAARACNTLQMEFPDSDYIADSLLAMAKAADLAGEPQQAVQIYQQIAGLPKGSAFAPEALYRIGEVYERQIERLVEGRTVRDAGMRQQAINSFRNVFATFPDSSFAGDALKHIGDHYLEDGNWNQAIDFFEQILRDYPDAPFVADVLYNLTVARGSKGDLKNARSAFSRLEREYPGYERMDKARTFFQGLEKKGGAAQPGGKAAPKPVLPTSAGGE